MTIQEAANSGKHFRRRHSIHWVYIGYQQMLRWVDDGELWTVDKESLNATDWDVNEKIVKGLKDGDK